MARKPRIHYDGAFYHVIARGNNKDMIFKQDVEKSKYLEKLFKYTGQFGAKLYAYVIMDNHCHMLMEAGAVPVSKIMQGVQQTYTSWYNKQHHRSGHVFEQRYKSILCDKDDYLLALVRYIHQNPVRAQIGDLDYPFSSHSLYLKCDKSVCRTDEVLGLFSMQKKRAVQLYLEFVSKADEIIVAKADKELAPDQVEVDVELSKSSFEKKDKAEITVSFEKKTGIKVETLRGKYLKRDQIKLRNALMKELVKYNATTQVELGKYFGLSDGYVSRICNKTE